MVKLTETASTKSSRISSKAASLKKTVQKGATAFARPFKKLKKSISTASTRSIRSRSSRSDNEAPGDGDDKSSTDGESTRSNGKDSDPEIELSPEQALGM